MDELLLVQRGREMGSRSATSSSTDRRQHQEAEQPRRRSAVPGGAEAGRDDDGRPAADLERQMLVVQVQRASRREDQRHRGGGAGVLRSAPAGVHDAVGDDAARDPHRGAGERPRRQRGAGRRRQGRGGSRSASGCSAASRLRGWRPSVRRAVEGQRRPDRPDQARRAGAGRCRRCSTR